MIRMTTHKESDGIIYRATRTRKAFFAVVFAFLLWGIIVTLQDPQATGSLLVPILLALLCLFGALYRESWSFEPARRRVVSVFGIGPIVKRSVYPYDSIKSLTITHFVKGDPRDDAKPDRKRHKRAMVVFSLVTKDDEAHTIEIIPERTSMGQTEKAAQLISSVSGLALTVDRPVDMDLHVGIRDL